MIETQAIFQRIPFHARQGVIDVNQDRLQLVPVYEKIWGAVKSATFQASVWGKIFLCCLCSLCWVQQSSALNVARLQECPPEVKTSFPALWDIFGVVSEAVDAAGAIEPRTPEIKAKSPTDTSWTVTETLAEATAKYTIRSNGELEALRLEGAGFHGVLWFQRSMPPPVSKVTDGEIEVEGKASYSFAYDGRPGLRLLLESPADPKGLVRALGWGADGEQVIDARIARRPNSWEQKSELLASISVNQALAIGALPTEVLASQKAFQSCDAELARKMENVVAWGYKFLHCTLQDAPALLDRQNYQQRVEGDQLILEFEPEHQNEAPIVLSFDQTGSRLCRFQRGTLSVFYAQDKSGQNYLSSGVGAINQPPTQYQMVSFYAGTLASRLALASTGSPPDALTPQGQLHMWDPGGVEVLRDTLQDPLSLRECFQKLEVRLSASQQQLVQWAGVDREVALLPGVRPAPAQ